MFWDFLQLLEDGEPVEEGVLEGLLEVHPPVGVVVEHPSHQVQHHRLLLAFPGRRSMPSEKEGVGKKGNCSMTPWMCAITRIKSGAKKSTYWKLTKSHVDVLLCNITSNLTLIWEDESATKCCGKRGIWLRYSRSGEISKNMQENRPAQKISKKPYFQSSLWIADVQLVAKAKTGKEWDMVHISKSFICCAGEI